MSDSAHIERPPRWQPPLSLVLSVAIGSVVPPTAALSPSSLSMFGTPNAGLLLAGALPYLILWMSAYMRARDHGAFVLSISTASVLACAHTLVIPENPDDRSGYTALALGGVTAFLLFMAFVRAVFDRLTLGRRSQDMAETCRFETSETVRRYAVVGAMALGIAVMRAAMAR